MSRSKLSDFEILSRLGSGSFGIVYKARRVLDDQVYVIKNVRIAELSYKEQTEAINEVQILAQLKSPYVVRYFDSFIEKDSLHIVMEFCNRGDLQNLLKKAKEKDVSGLKENVIWNISLQIILGLFYLHKKHILHRDLKTANVFLMKDSSNPNYLVKIGDLGVAKLMDTSTALANTIVGTPYYLSPELCRDMPYRDKSDCWALGVLLYECCTLLRPFDARNQCALIMKIIEEPVKPPNAVSSILSNLVLWLLQKEPNNRPNIRELLCEASIVEKMKESNLELPEEILDLPRTHNLSPLPATEKILIDEEKGLDSQFRPKDSKLLSENSGESNVRQKTNQTYAKVVPAKSEQKQKIRGDRVRGSNKRVTSEKALQRYQLKPSFHGGSNQIEGPIETKSQTQNTISDRQNSISISAGTDDPEETYEEDFENLEEDPEPIGEYEFEPAPKCEQKEYDAVQAEKEIESKSFQSANVDPFLDVENLSVLISDAKEKAIESLGEELFRKVYELCKTHMTENYEEEDEGTLALVQELESILCHESNANIEAACEAVFGVKLLLALQSKYDKLINKGEEK